MNLSFHQAVATVVFIILSRFSFHVDKRTPRSMFQRRKCPGISLLPAEMSKCTIVPVRIGYRLISVTDSIISKYPGICKEEDFMTRTQRAICIGVYQVRLKGHSQSAQVCPRKDTWASAIFGHQWCPRLCSHNDRELKVQSFPADKTRYNFSISKYINFGCSIDVNSH